MQCIAQLMQKHFRTVRLTNKRQASQLSRSCDVVTWRLSLSIEPETENNKQWRTHAQPRRLESRHTTSHQRVVCRSSSRSMRRLAADIGGTPSFRPRHRSLSVCTRRSVVVGTCGLWYGIAAGTCPHSTDLPPPLDDVSKGHSRRDRPVQPEASPPPSVG